MRLILLYFLTIIFFAGCKKEQAPPVEIYLLKSFTTSLDSTTTPWTLSITNAVPEDKPLVADSDILFYTKSNTTFTLKKDIQTVIQNFNHNKAFVITVDKRPIYYGIFHPLYLSSMVFGIATIAPFNFHNNELKIDFVLDGSSILQQLDKRNDSRIINSLKATFRLR